MESLVDRHHDGLRDGRMLAHRCTSCLQITFPMTTACTGCGSFDHEEVQLSGHGLLLFATHTGAPPAHPPAEGTAPHVYAHVLLDEGVPVQAVLRGVAATPAAMADLYDRRNVIVELQVLETPGLPVLAFRPLTPARCGPPARRDPGTCRARRQETEP